MSIGSSGGTVIAAFRSLFSNLYFWAGLGGLLLVASLLYVMVDQVIMPNYTRYGTAIEIPDVRNEPLEVARQEIEDLGFRVEEEDGQYNPNVPQDVVVDQSPAPSTPIKPNRRVYLTVNRGEVPTVVLPDLSGTSQREARSRLEGRGLEVEMQPDSLPSPHEGTITRQSPEPADTVEVGSQVSLWYSTGLGDTETTIPNLIGLSVEEARSRLEARQLRPVLVYSRDDSERDDSADTRDDRNTSDEDQSPDESDLFVLDQDKPSESEVRTGTEIRLYVTEDADAVPAVEDSTADSTNALSSDPSSNDGEEARRTW